MGFGSKAPAAPDSKETAKEEARVNRVDTYTPDGGGVRYGYTKGDQFVQGVAPDGFQSAVKQRDSPLEAALRKNLTPAAGSITGMATKTAAGLGAAPAAGAIRPDAAGDRADRGRAAGPRSREMG